MENELVVQMSMKQEMELAMKLLEKDIHEKQVSLHFPFPSFYDFTLSSFVNTDLFIKHVKSLK